MNTTAIVARVRPDFVVSHSPTAHMSRPTRRFQFYFVVKDVYGRNVYGAPKYQTCKDWCDDRPGGAGRHLRIEQTYWVYDDPTTCRRAGLSPNLYWG